MRRGAAVLLFLAASVALSRAAKGAELFVAPAAIKPPAVHAAPWPTSVTGYAAFGFAVPADFASLRAARVVVLSKSSGAAAYDARAGVRRSGEAASPGAVSSLGVPVVLAAGTVQEIDVTPLIAPEIAASSAGVDFVALTFEFPASPAREDGTVIGLRFVYTRQRLRTADLAAEAVTSGKLADEAVASRHVANGSLTGADVRNHDLTGADFADGTIGAADLGPNAVGSAAIETGAVRSAEVGDGEVGSADVAADQVQRRITGTCPPGESVLGVAESGSVACGPDPAGLDHDHTWEYQDSCGVRAACRRTLHCPAGMRIVGGGVNLAAAFTFELYNRFGIAESHPSSDTGWTVSVVNRNPHDVQIAIYITCSGTSVAAATNAARAAPPPLRQDRPMRP
jgi:hypothetical protein